MYDKYPEFDVPRSNLIQRFLGQHWSAILIEIVMTIVISVAAGHAFDLFGPFESPSAAQIEAPVQLESLANTPDTAQGEFQFSGLTAYDECGRGECALAHIALGRSLLAQGELDGMLAHFARAIEIGSEDPAVYLEIKSIYDTLGLPRSAGRIHEQIEEKFAKRGNDVAQLVASAGKGAG